MSAAVTSGLITVANNAESMAVSITYDAGFYQRVAAITTETAFAVCRENDGGADVNGHVNRASRALQWFTQSTTASAQQAIAQAVASDNLTNESSTSQEIADRIAFLWDTLSGN
jgi:hypothetical protein